MAGRGVAHQTRYPCRTRRRRRWPSPTRQAMDVAVEELESTARTVAFERVGVQRRPQLPHQRRGTEAVTDHVADYHTDQAPGQLDHVIPVAADLVASRLVAGGDPRPGDVGDPPGEQAALEHHGDPVLALQRLVQARALDPGGCPRGRDLEDRQVTLTKCARLQEPTCSTPISPPSTTSGTPSSERIPFSRRIGLSTSAWLTSAMKIGRRSDAIRPANPLPMGMRRRPPPPPRCPWPRAPPAPEWPRRSEESPRCRRPARRASGPGARAEAGRARAQKAQGHSSGYRWRTCAMGAGTVSAGVSATCPVPTLRGASPGCISGSMRRRGIVSLPPGTSTPPSAWASWRGPVQSPREPTCGSRGGVRTRAPCAIRRRLVPSGGRRPAPR